MGGGRLDRMNFREYAIFQRDRNKMVEESEIESEFSNT